MGFAVSSTFGYGQPRGSSFASVRFDLIASRKEREVVWMAVIPSAPGGVSDDIGWKVTPARPWFGTP